MLMMEAVELAIIWNAAFDRTNVVPLVDGIEFSMLPWSTTLTCTVLPLTQAFGVGELRHRTVYALPQAAPLSHTPSPAAAKRLFGGNRLVSPPKQTVAGRSGRRCQMEKINTLRSWTRTLTSVRRAVVGGSAHIRDAEAEEEGEEESATWEDFPGRGHGRGFWKEEPGGAVNGLKRESFLSSSAELSDIRKNVLMTRDPIWFTSFTHLSSSFYANLDGLCLEMNAKGFLMVWLRSHEEQARERDQGLTGSRSEATRRSMWS